MNTSSASEARSPAGAALPLICLLGVVLRFYDLSEPQLWLDELIQLLSFSHASLRESLYQLTRQPAVVPLDYMVQSIFVGIWGNSEWGARFHAALFGSLSLPLFYLIVERILSRRQALIGTFILAVYPLHVFYSREGRNYSIFFFLALLSLYLLLKALEWKTSRGWFGYGFVLVLLLYTNYLAGLILIAQATVVMGWYRFPKAREDLSLVVKESDLVRFFASLVAASTLFLPWLLITVERAQANFSEDLLHARFLLRVWRELSGGSSPLSLTLMILIGLGLWRLRSKRRYGVLLLLGAWFSIPFFGVLFLDWWRGYFFAIRQVLVATPALIVPAAAGVTGKSLFKGVPGLILLLIASLGIGTLLLSDRKNEADWKGLVQYLERIHGDDAIVAPRIESIVAFRYPEFEKRRLSLEAVRERIEAVEGTLPLDPSKEPAQTVHIVDYRPVVSSELNALLEKAPLSVSTSLRGFEIHVLHLPPSGSDPTPR